MNAATIALRAAEMRNSTGWWAARRYAERNLKPGQMYLFRLACQLLASNNFNLGEN